MKEKLTRRNFLKAVGLLGAVDLTLALGLRFGDDASVVYRYLDAYIKGENNESLPALTEIERNIIVDESLQNGPVVANKEAFVLGAVVTALHKDPKMGLFNLLTFLRRFPLTLQAEKSDRSYSIDNKGNNSLAFAHYKPLFSGGPVIGFYPSFFAHYRKGIREVNPEIQIENDASVYHELTHLMQDASHPFIFSSQSTGSNNYDYNQDPLELEAFSLSGAIVMEEFQKVLSANISYWPLGKFFEFKGESLKFEK